MSNDECMDNLIIAYSIFASKGARIITKEGTDITDDIVKAKPVTEDVNDD